ncbi:MAG: M81 family metallopeptidase [Anaerolineae bacterium]
MIRIAVGQIMQESHSFTAIPCSWDQFAAGYIHHGEDLVGQMQDARVEVAGGVSVAKRHSLEVAPLMACSAVSSGVILQPVFDELLGELLDRLRAALPVDGVFIALHGAMCSEADDDASGRVLEAVRGVIGPDVPVAATLDLHANVTRRMAEQADILVGYKTCPHVDLYETGAAAMDLLVRTVRGEISPRIALRRLPMLLPAEKSVTTDGPFHDLMQQAMALEPQPGTLSASLFYVQPWLDLPDVGASVVVVTDGDTGLAEREAESLADAFWTRRTDCVVHLTPIDEAVERALAATAFPVVLADGADSPSGGASGDSTALLIKFLAADSDREILLNIVDPTAVARAIDSGVGTEVTLTVGGWSTDLYPPVEVTGTVRLIHDGKVRFKGPSYQGVEFHRGRTAVLQVGSIHLQIMEKGIYQFDPEIYKSVGADPREAHIVIVKSPSAFRAAFEPFAAEIIHVDAPGLTSSNLKSFPWKRLPRPFYPFDAIEDWRMGSV